MNDILAHLQYLEPYLTGTTVRPMSHIVVAMQMMTGRVTMLGMPLTRPNTLGHQGRIK